MNALLTPLTLTLSEPSSADKTADWERLLDRLRHEAGIAVPVDIDPTLLRSLSPRLREHAWRLSCVLGHGRERSMIVSLGSPSAFAAAVDIGTTNIVGSLFDLATGELIAGIEKRNPQTAVGLDVLTRVHLAMGGKGRELHRMLIEGVNALLGELCRGAGLSDRDLQAVAVAGNTIMTHFLLDLAVDNIPVEPYVPVIHRVDFVDPRSISLAMNPYGVLYVFPNAGSYVGGDIIAGILSSGLYKEREPALLIDVGTNAEIVLGCDEWIIVGAGAAGPALEGGIAEIGMSASEGAINEVSIGPLATSEGETGTGLTVSLHTIGGTQPRGLCGSGMIELVSELYASGIIDRTGKFVDDAPCIVAAEGRKGFVITPTDDGALILKDTEIENFLRSKAAMFSSLQVIVRSVGLKFADIRKVYVSGAFGMGINVEKAISIGMIPKIPKERFVPVGNSSLKGAELILHDRGLLSEIDRIAAMITYKEMNTDREFMKEFPAALFIPHTNPEVLEV
ncbi:MAG: ASKHA domain-containing protein [Chloroflexota bacterium]